MRPARSVDARQRPVVLAEQRWPVVPHHEAPGHLRTAERQLEIHPVIADVRPAHCGAPRATGRLAGANDGAAAQLVGHALGGFGVSLGGGRQQLPRRLGELGQHQGQAVGDGVALY
jgi:hypothetical protein